MVKISDNLMTDNIRRQSVGGYRRPEKPKVMKISKGVERRLKDSIITPAMYEEMLYFAKYQPSGKRKLNDTNLSRMVIGEDIAPLTDTQGLRKGGMVSEGNVNKKPLKNKTIKLTVKNTNRLKNNPNYTSFKNDFKL